MLVLSRRKDETIMIGDTVEITIVDIKGGSGYVLTAAHCVTGTDIPEPYQTSFCVGADGGARDEQIVESSGQSLLDEAALAAFRAARALVLGDIRPASTLAVVRALAAPQYLVEIEAIAIRP